MLPDFVQVVYQQGDEGEAAARSLFQSAEAVLQMWARVEARSGVTGDPSVLTCPRP